MANGITPYLLYEDGAAAMEFLSRAFGFEEVLRSHSPEGRMWHGEMTLAGGRIYLGEPGGDYRNPKRLGGVTVDIHVYVDDVDAHYERAKAAGADVRSEPEDRPYGDRVYHALDPEGHDWFFGTRIRDVAPEEWGATVASEA